MEPLPYSARRDVGNAFPARRCKAWTTDALRRLRELATVGITVRDIAKALGRSESAVRNKAGLHGISLEIRPRRARV